MTLQYNVISLTGNSALVQFIVTNSSTISSATHPPVIGYTPLWNNTIGSALDNIFSSVPMSKTTQTFNCTETLTW